MKKPLRKVREEARRLYLAGEASSNVEIATRLKVKPHTVARWRKEEDWDGLRLKIDRRAAEMFVEKIATDRVTLNVRHYRLWDLLVTKLMEDLKGQPGTDIRELDRIAGILERAQKGQRLAKGLTTTGESEEEILAKAEAQQRHLIDVFIDSPGQRLGRGDPGPHPAAPWAIPDEADAGAGDPGDPCPDGASGDVGGEEDPTGRGAVPVRGPCIPQGDLRRHLAARGALQGGADRRHDLGHPA